MELDDCSDSKTSSASMDSYLENKKPMFSYLIINTDKMTNRVNTHIGKSTNPFIKVELHNACATKTSKKRTKSAAPAWKLVMIIGPFNNHGELDIFSGAWKKTTRGILSRYREGYHYARTFKKEIWIGAECPEEFASIQGPCSKEFKKQMEEMEEIAAKVRDKIREQVRVILKMKKRKYSKQR